MANEQFNNFCHAADMAVSDEELEQVSGGGKMPMTSKTCPSGHKQDVDYFQWMNNYQLWCKGCQAYISGSQWT